MEVKGENTSVLDKPAKPPEGPYGVPRQLGLKALVGVTVFFAGIFGLLRALDADALTGVAVAAFLGAVAIGQMFLFKGKRPRLSSIVVGSSFSLVVFAAALLYD